MCIRPQWLSKLNWFKLIRSLKCFLMLNLFSYMFIKIFHTSLSWFNRMICIKGPNEIKSLKLKMYNTRGPTIVHFQVHSRERKFLSVCSNFNWASFLIAQLIVRQHQFRSSRGRSITTSNDDQVSWPHMKSICLNEFALSSIQCSWFL